MMMFMVWNGTPRAAFGVTPQGTMPVARQSRFHGILKESSLARQKVIGGHGASGESQKSQANER
jgi:hypothetical protein